MRRPLLPLLLLLLLSALSPADETREKTLPNGLKIIVHPMSGAPLATVLTMYRVGSANEPAGQTGITHLCEHMLFKGSARFPKGEVALATARYGGAMNGFTNVDEITFFQVVPRERVGEFLDRHADAMENATFDPEEFRKEMVVVRSELEGDENDPGWLLERAVFATAFQVSGLHHPVIGWREDVESVTPEQVKAWYRAHFRPNNAVVIVVGDVDADATVADIEKKFGGFAPGQVPFEPAAEPRQDGERRVLVRAPASGPVVEFAWHNAPTGHPDSFALEVVQEALGKGRRARLYRALVDTGLATDVGVGNYWCRYPTLFTIQVTGVPGKDPAEIEAALDFEVRRIAAEGLPAEEVARCVRQLARARAFSLDSTEEVAAAIADFEAFSSWRYGLAFAEEVAKVTPERIQAAARKYLVADNRTVGVLLPDRKSASPDLAKAASEIDRNPKLSGRASGAARAPKPPVEFVLANGLRVLFWENPSSPTVAIRARWPGGMSRDGKNSGLAGLVLEMLHEGTEARDKAAFNELLEAKGFTLETSLRFEYSELATAGLAEDFETAATLLAEVLSRPRWPEDAFGVARERVIGWLSEEEGTPLDCAQRAVRRALFPPGHPRHVPTLEGALAAAKVLAVAEARAFHESFCRPRATVVAISGALEEAAARRVAEKAFGGWKSEGDVAPLVFPEPLGAPAERRVVVFIPEKSEATCAVAFPCSVRPGDPDAPAFGVLNHILAGGEVWATRLGRKIRVENGLAYGVDSQLTPTRGNGYLWVEFGCNPDNVDKAMALLKEELRKVREEGLTAEEIRDGISYSLGAYPRDTETSEQKAATLVDIGWFGLGADWVSRRADAYRAVTKEKVDALAKKFLDPERMFEVIAGTYGGK
ncbi:MAG: insulinase family protein [Planctomycetes bacterium]|nr:insulinase family protein [Planctomycetota bacterium]